MNVRKHFDASRFWLLLKTELFKSRTAIAITIVVMFGLDIGFVLSQVVDAGGSKIIYDHHINYFAAMLIGGFVLSSFAFNDLGHALRRYQYLTLPVSAFEKFLCMWLLTSVGWIVLFTTCFTLFAWVANPVGHALFPHITFLPFDPTSGASMDAMHYYFVLQGIFLVGAAHFHGYAFVKTLFVLALFAIVAGFIAYLISRGSVLIDHECTSPGECAVLHEIGLHPAWLLMKWIFWWMLAPVCWIITYVGLKEMEV